jgi:hypothetical protein
MKKESLFQLKQKNSKKNLYESSKIENFSDQIEKKVSYFSSQEKLNSDELNLVQKKREDDLSFESEQDDSWEEDDAKKRHKESKDKIKKNFKVSKFDPKIFEKPAYDVKLVENNLKKNYEVKEIKKINYYTSERIKKLFSDMTKTTKCSICEEKEHGSDFHRKDT